MMFQSFLVFVLLSICACISEGPKAIPGRPTDGAEGVPGYAIKLKTGYQIDPEFACEDGTKPVYRSSLEYYEDGSVLLKDTCTSETTSIDTSGLDTLSPEIAGYEEGIYEILPNPPTPETKTYLSMWCKIIDYQDAAGGFVVRTDFQTKAHIGLGYGVTSLATTFTQPFSLQITEATNYYHLTSNYTFEAFVSKSLVPVNPFFHPGIVKWKGAEHDIVCRYPRG